MSQSDSPRKLILTEDEPWTQELFDEYMALAVELGFIEDVGGEQRLRTERGRKMTELLSGAAVLEETEWPE